MRIKKKFNVTAMLQKLTNSLYCFMVCKIYVLVIWLVIMNSRIVVAAFAADFHIISAFTGLFILFWWCKPLQYIACFLELKE